MEELGWHKTWTGVPGGMKQVRERGELVWHQTGLVERGIPYRNERCTRMEFVGEERTVKLYFAQGVWWLDRRLDASLREVVDISCDYRLVV